MLCTNLSVNKFTQKPNWYRTLKYSKSALKLKKKQISEEMLLHKAQIPLALKARLYHKYHWGRDTTLISYSHLGIVKIGKRRKKNSQGQNYWIYRKYSNTILCIFLVPQSALTNYCIAKKLMMESETSSDCGQTDRFYAEMTIVRGK